VGKVPPHALQGLVLTIDAEVTALRVSVLDMPNNGTIGEISQSHGVPHVDRRENLRASFIVHDTTSRINHSLPAFPLLDLEVGEVVEFHVRDT